MYNQYVDLVEKVMAEQFNVVSEATGRDGQDLIDPGHVEYAKKKMKLGPEALAKYFEHLKKNELTRLTDAGKDHYVARLKQKLSVKEAKECDVPDEEEECDTEETVEEAKECDSADKEVVDGESDSEGDESEMEEASCGKKKIKEGRDGIENIDRGHLEYAKKKMKQGPEALAKYFEHLKKNELTRLPEAGKDHYVARLKKLLTKK